MPWRLIETGIMCVLCLSCVQDATLKLFLRLPTTSENRAVNQPVGNAAAMVGRRCDRAAIINNNNAIIQEAEPK